MDQHDWREKLTVTVSKETVLPWNNTVVPKGARLRLVSNVNLPKKRGLVLPVPSLTALYIGASEKAWEKYWGIRTNNKIDSSLKKQVEFRTDTEAFDAIENLANSVVSAYSALEAFCNESIPEDHEYWHHRKSEVILEKSDKKSIERYFSTSNKLQEILPAIFSVSSPKGHSPAWSSYKQLKLVRDGLVHAKSHETRSAQPNEKNLWDRLFTIPKPYRLAKDVFDWYLGAKDEVPNWYKNFPK
jgi:hypothetical protein